MKVLTLQQPWATLVAIGAKRIETRSRRTSYTGPLAIHSSSRIPGWAQGHITEEPFRSALMRARPGGTPWEQQELLPCGVILAVCQLRICHPTGTFILSDRERAFGDYSPGRWAWFLTDIRRLDKPVPAKGRLGLWEIDDALLANAKYVEVPS